MEISLDELTEILAESFECHKDWWDNKNEFVSSYLKELKDLCNEYKLRYDERKAYRTMEYFDKKYGLVLNSQRSVSY